MSAECLPAARAVPRLWTRIRGAVTSSDRPGLSYPFAIRRPPMRSRLALLAFLSASPLYGQSAVSDSSPFRELPLPTPNAVRTGSGRPGAGCWQQRVDYRIAASWIQRGMNCKAAKRSIIVNRSPDALPYLWMFLEQNMCEPGSVTNRLNQPPLVFLGSVFDFSCKGFQGGLTLEAVRSLRSGAAA